MTKVHNQNPIYKPTDNTLKNALIQPNDYDAMYKHSLEDPDSFWAERAKRLDWFKHPDIIKNAEYSGDHIIKWYEDGQLNACYNCVDRHADKQGDKVAFYWEGDDPSQDAKITYSELKDHVSKVANGLKEMGVKKGDRVIIYMPMLLEASYAMLACARIGAIHSVVFGGFSPDAIASRIKDCGANIIITADEGYRSGKTVPLKANTDKAIEISEGLIKDVLVFKRSGGDINWTEGRDFWWHDIVDKQSIDCPCEVMDAEDPLFILYTSGSTGTPKGVMHTTGGYMVYASMTHEYIFDLKSDSDIYWCTADVGWITGHSYLVYGPLANGCSSVYFEGVPSYPDYSRFWQIVEKYKVSIFYTAPTAIRALLKEGDEFVTKHDRSSLRILGTVGEPINLEAWQWYYNVIGEGRCHIVDTWWQTETGGIMITPLACHDLKPGKACKPFFGVQPQIVDADGHVLEGKAEGLLCMAGSWPGQMRSVYGDHQRFIETYFSQVPGKYFTGDGALRDADGDLRITGRVDDVINVSGHRFGTAEIENAINEHEYVAESAVVGFPHDIKGQGIYAYVILREGAAASDDTRKNIIALVRQIIGPIANPDVIHFSDDLPKTRSGKIMRRILRKIAAGDTQNLGDISTLADPSCVNKLIQSKS